MKTKTISGFNQFGGNGGFGVFGGNGGFENNSIYDSDAESYFTLAAITDFNQKNAINNFVRTLKINSIWNKAVDIGLYISGDGTIANALKKIKYPTGLSTSLNNGTTALTDANYSIAGVVATATGRKIDTQVIPTSQGLTNNNFYYCVGIVNDTIAGGANMMLDNKASGGATAYIGKTAIGMNGGGLQNSVPQIMNGHSIRSLSSNATVIYIDGFGNIRPAGTATPAVTMDASVSVLGGKSFGANSFGTGTIGFHGIFSYLTYAEDVILKQAVRTLWNSIGRKTNIKDVVFFGDSLTFGTTTGSGVHTPTDRFSYSYSQALGLAEQNCGIGGSGYRITSGGVLGGYPRRSDILNYNIANGGKVVISYATNDCRNDTGSGTAATIADYKNKLITFCQELKASSVSASDIILVGTPLLNDGTTQARQNAWTLGTRDAAVAEGVYYVDMNAYMTANGGVANLQADNIHLSIAGNLTFKNGLLTAAAV